MQADKGKKYPGKYCVAGGPNGAMHEFPKKVGSSLRKAWIKFVQRHRHNWQPSSYTCLCSAHFEASCFHQQIAVNLEDTNTAKTKRLLDRSLAIPTIDAVSTERTSDAVSLRGRMQVREYQYVNNYIQCLL